MPHCVNWARYRWKVLHRVVSNFPCYAQFCRCVAYSPFCQYLQVYHISRHTLTGDIIISRLRSALSTKARIIKSVKCPKAECKQGRKLSSPWHLSSSESALNWTPGSTPVCRGSLTKFTGVTFIASLLIGHYISTCKTLLAYERLTRVLPVSPPGRSLLSQ